MTRRTFLLTTAATPALAQWRPAGGPPPQPKAAAKEPREVKGKRLVLEALDALGGNNFLAMEDRIESGRAFSFYREQLRGLSLAKIYTRYLSIPPDPRMIGQRERQTFGKNQDNSVLFTETEAWDLTFRGARPLPEDQIARWRLSTLHNIFYILRQRLKEPGILFEWQSTEVWGNQPVEVIDINDTENRTVTVSFHQSTKLPVKQLFYRRDPNSKERIDEVTVYSKYRDVGNGVQWPFTILRERNGEKIFEIFADTVTINQNLTDDKFLIPSTIKKLEK